MTASSTPEDGGPAARRDVPPRRRGRADRTATRASRSGRASFLEGNFFVDLQPGSPAAPRARGRGARSRSARPTTATRIGDVLGSLRKDVRSDLQGLLRELDAALRGRRRARASPLDPATGSRRTATPRSSPTRCAGPSPTTCRGSSTRRRPRRPPRRPRPAPRCGRSSATCARRRRARARARGARRDASPSCRACCAPPCPALGDAQRRDARRTRALAARRASRACARRRPALRDAVAARARAARRC